MKTIMLTLCLLLVASQAFALTFTCEAELTGSHTMPSAYSTLPGYQLYKDGKTLPCYTFTLTNTSDGRRSSPYIEVQDEKGGTATIAIKYEGYIDQGQTISGEFCHDGPKIETILNCRFQ